MPTPIAIVTDSTSDLPADLAAARQIHVTPLHILWGKEQLRDGVDLSREAFYRRLATARDMPTTSQPSPGDFAAAFEAARHAANAEAVLAVTISAGLSGTYAAATEAARMVDFPVHVVNSRTTSGALGLFALALADARDRGTPIDTIKTLAADLTHRTRAILAIDTLEFLHRSGRVSAVRRWLGTALQIKPILYVRNGRLEPLEAVRTRQRAITRMLDIFNTWVDPDRPLHIAILHSDRPQEAEALEATLRERWNPAFSMQVIASSAVGVHTGPGAMGLTLLQ